MREFARRLMLAGLLVVTGSTACSDGRSAPSEPEPTPATPAPAQRGSLQITITGLPAGVNAAVRVVGAAFTQTVTQSTTLSLAPGSYTITADAVRAADETGYGAGDAPQSIAVSAGGTAMASVNYAVSTGALRVVINGLPSGVAAPIVVTSATFSRSLTATGTLNGLAPGAYQVQANPVSATDGTYAAGAPLQQTNVTVGSTATVTIAYAFSPATALDVTRLVDSIRVAFDLPALGGAIVTANNATYAIGVAGTRRVTGGNAVTRADLWHLGSNFKAFTSMLAAIAVDRGRLSWSTTIAQAFPELGATIRTEYRAVTLRDLLSHQSGVVRDAPGSAISGATRTAQRNAVTAWAVQQPPLTPRGTYNYTNVGYIIAGAMIERALGASFEDAMVANVFAPLGIVDAGFGPQATTGSTAQPVAHRLVGGQWLMLENFDNPPVYASPGGTHMSIGSWARFLQEVLRMEAGTATLASLSAERETTASISTVGGTDTYGMGWIITSRGWANGRTLTHNGTNTGNHSVTWMAPLRGFAVLAVTNSYDPATTNSRTARALDALVSRLISFRETGR